MDTHKGTILIVDDVPTNLSVLMRFLENTEFEVLIATDGESAVEQAAYTLPDIVLLDVMMPGIDGFETCRRLKTGESTRDIPLIFMTALFEALDKVQRFELGAADYLTKPLQQEEVVARVNAHLTLHRQEQELERQKREIEQLREQDRIHYERLSSIKDDMLSTASHDLKNPLTAITLAVELLHRYVTEDDTRIHKKLDDIHTAAVYMGELIVNLLDLARLETGIGLQIKPVSMRQLLETSINYTASAAHEKGTKLRLQLPEDEITIKCDPFQIGQVLVNLIANAVKYTPDDGTIEISADIQGNLVYFQVTDIGLGIPETDIPHIFDKFYRVNSEAYKKLSGTGLGLSIVREIIQQYGGSIEVTSTVGKGSTFSFSLPQ